MLVQFVQFETALNPDETLAIARARAPEFRAIPDLMQKFYLKLDKPNHFGGLYVWKSPEALQTFRQSDLARSIPAAYRVIGAPDVSIHELMFPLRDDENIGRAPESA